MDFGNTLEKLKEAFKKTEAGTYAYTVYKQGISKVEEFDVQIEENDREHVDLEQKLREIQEKMTAQIADTLMEVLQPKGVMVVAEAMHMCMVMRGIKKPGAMTKTIYSTGIFKEDLAMRQEVLNLIKG